jgi:hypothetical protein
MEDPVSSFIVTDTPHVAHFFITVILLFSTGLVGRFFRCVPLHVFCMSRFSTCSNAWASKARTLDPLLVLLRVTHKQRSSLAVQGVAWIRVS